MPTKPVELLTEAALLTGAELVAVSQGGNSRRVTLTRLMQELGGGAGTLRLMDLAEGTPMDPSGLLLTAELTDVNNGLIVPKSADVKALSLPHDAAVGDTLLVIYGDPEEALLAPYGTPGALTLGAFDDEYAVEISLVYDIVSETFVSLEYGQTKLIKKTSSLAVGPQTYHFWAVIAETGVAVASGGGGGGGGFLARWNGNGYNTPAESRYSTFAGAHAALVAVGGGTLEVIDYGTVPGGYYEMYNIDLVGVTFSSFRVILSLQPGCILDGLRSIRNVTVDGPETGDPAISNAGRRLIVDDCDIGSAYPNVVPVLGYMAYLELRGNTIIGAGTIIGPGQQLYITAHDAAVVLDEAIDSGVASLTSYAYGSSYISETHAGVSGAITSYQLAMERFRPLTMSNSGTPAQWANRFIEGDTDTAGGNISIAASGTSGLAGTSVGARAWVAKRGTGGNVTITGLTYVPGGGTTYTITVENAVVELLWLPGGVQVKP
jgi:hypothetical protein